MEVLDSRQLNAFCTLADTGSFTEAAKRLNLTQSAVSHSIKALETTIGCQLFDRAGKKLHLTTSGEALLKHALAIMDQMQSATDSLLRLRMPGHGRLRIGATVSISEYVLPKVLREFKESFPLYDISVNVADTRGLIALQEDGESDFTIFIASDPHPRLTSLPLFSDELGFIVSPMHYRSMGASMDREWLSKQKYICYSRESETFHLIKKSFERRGLMFSAPMALGSMDAIKEMARLGLGVGIVAPWIAIREIDQGSLSFIPTDAPKMTRDWALCYDKSRTLSLADEVFLGICRSVCQSITVEEAATLERVRRSQAESEGSVRSPKRTANGPR